MTNPKCPVCGLEMRQTRRGATLRKRGPAYICPKDEAETWRDPDGNYHRMEGALHKPARRTWEEWEITR